MRLYLVRDLLELLSILVEFKKKVAYPKVCETKK